MDRPNILYIHSHDTGRYIQPYGHAIPTPNLQRLAEEGVLFRQNFCVNPTCSPSRACLLTGEYAHNNGMFGLAHRGFSLNDYSHHILHTLREHGYHSVLSGVQHIARHQAGTPDNVIGYDEILGSAAEAEVKAVEWLETAPKTPWFMSCGFFETHRTFPHANPTEDPRYTLPPAPLPDTPENREDMARYKAMARILDQKMGAVFAALKRTGQYDNTLIVCTTDHGIAFPRMKCNLHDSGTGVMLIMRGPGGFIGGQVVDAMTSHIDVFPTVCDVLGIEAPDRLQGVSVRPLVTGEKTMVRDEVFTEVNYHASYEPMRGVRTDRYKYIRRFDPRTSPVLPNCDDSFSKDTWLNAGWRDRAPAGEELYDLVFDPNETNNLAEDPAMAEVLAAMRGRIDRWMMETDDPLLKGPVEAPEGAVVNDIDGLSPREELKPAR